MIRVDALRKSFRTADGFKAAVDGVSFEVQEGEFFTLLGPSGCGKTTTLRCIAGLERPDAGVIAIGGEEVFRDRVLVPTNERDLGMVFQSYAVWPHMSVADNVAFPLTVAREKPSRARIREQVAEALDLVGLGGYEGRMATQLSGGQQQRLSLARALVRSPAVLLLDEPLSNLDAKLRERMRSELRTIQRRVGVTTLFVTHDQVEALSLSDRIAVLRDGEIVQLGTPREIYHEPGSAFVAGFIGGTNVVVGTVVHDAGDGSLSVDTSIGLLHGVGASGLARGDRVAAGIRLEDVVLLDPHGEAWADGHNRLRGRVGAGTFNGSSVDYLITVEGQVLQARAGSRTSFEVGSEIGVLLPPEFVRVLPADAGAVPAERIDA